MKVNLQIEDMHLTEHTIKDINVGSSFDQRLTLRHGRVTKDLSIKGVINPETIDNNPREVEAALNIASFAMIMEYKNCYKDITYSLSNSNGKIVLQGSLKKAYVVQYSEEFSNDTGVGEFTATFRELYGASKEAIKESAEQVNPVSYIVADDTSVIAKADDSYYEEISKKSALAKSKEIKESRKKRKWPTMVSAVVDPTLVDPETGQPHIFYGESGAIPKKKRTDKNFKIHDELEKLLPAETAEFWVVDNCAEVDAVNQALHSGSKIETLIMTTIRVQTDKPEPMCKNCKTTMLDVTVTSG